MRYLLLSLFFTCPTLQATDTAPPQQQNNETHITVHLTRADSSNENPSRCFPTRSELAVMSIGCIGGGFLLVDLLFFHYLVHALF
jgi:hypothetical protein